MNRREERWGRERWAGDDYESQRNPARFRGEDSDVERGGGWGRSGEYQGRGSGVPSQSGSYRSENDAGSRGGDYYAGREDYRGREGYRASESGRGSGGYASEEPFGMSLDEGRVQWRRREPGTGQQYGLDRYGSGYEDRAGRSGYPASGGGSSRGERRWGDDESRYSDYGTNYPSGHSFGDESQSYGPQGFAQGGGRLMRYGRHERGSHSGASPTNGPYSGVGPKGYRRSSDRLKEQVCDLLEDNGELDASDIEVRVEEDGTVTLTGTVVNRHMKRVAEDLAGSVTGISDVSNQLKVRSRDNQQEGSRQEGSGSEGSRGKTGKESTSSRSSLSGSSSTKPGF